MATVLVGLAIELGRVIVGSEDFEAVRPTVEGTIALARQTLAGASGPGRSKRKLQPV